MVTLKIRPTSPKCNQIFNPSQRYNIWSFATIHHLVQEIGCRQAFFWSKFGNFKALVWPWKWSQGRQNRIISFPPPNNMSVQVWSKSTHWFRRQSVDKKLRRCRRWKNPHQKQYVPLHLWLGGGDIIISGWSRSRGGSVGLLEPPFWAEIFHFHGYFGTS